MNKEQRKQIKKALEHLEKAQDILQEVGIDEQTAFDHLPESLQKTNKQLENNAYVLETAVDDIVSITENIDTLL